MALQPSFNKPERIHSPEQEMEVFKNSVHDTMDKIYGSSFEDASEQKQVKVVKKALDDHFDKHVTEKFQNPFEKKAEAEAIVLNLSPDEDDQKMSELLALVQDIGVISTIKAIEKTESYHVRDDLHRVLVQYIRAGHPAKLPEGSPMSRGLHLSLFEVYLPLRDNEDDSKKDLKTLLASMEQFYAGMASVAGADDKRYKGPEYFSIEIAMAQGRDEIVFYCAVPEERVEIFKSNTRAIFPGIKIIDSRDDYNIFNKKEKIAASVATLEQSDLLPLKTFDEFEYDPLNIILESFSSLLHEEGASIQIMFAADDIDISEKIYKSIEKIEEGEDPKEALKISESTFEKISKGLGSLFDNKTEEEREKEKEKALKRAERSDRKELVEELQKKNRALVYKTNIRLIAAGDSDAHAGSILRGIEAAFNQFESTTGNKFIFRRLEKKLLNELVRKFTFRIFDDNEAVYLNTKELTGLLHFHRKEGGSDILKTSQSNTAGASVSTIAASRETSVNNRIPGKVLLGINRHQGVENTIYMDAADRLRHMYVIGQTGTGKTTLLKNMIIQDIKNGEGCCFIDPHGSDIEDIMANIPPERYDDVIYFDPADIARPMGLNMLEYDARYPEQKTFVVNEMLSIFNKLFDMKTAGGPMFEQYFRNATMLVLEDPSSGNTLLDISRVLSDKEFRNQKLANCHNPIVKQFWEKIAGQAGGEASLENIVPYITSKFDNFLSNDIMRPIVTQEKSAFRFREVMDEKKILLVNLSKGRLGELNANLLGLIIVGKILMAALSRVDMEESKRAPFYLYIDEFQNVTTDSISQIFSEARKYKLSLSVAHQFIKQLDEKIRDSVFGNVGSFASFRVSAEDAEFLEKYYKPTFTASDIMNIENRNAYVKMLVNGSPEKPFSMGTLAPEKGNPEILAKLKELSSVKFGRPREEVEAETFRKYK